MSLAAIYISALLGASREFVLLRLRVSSLPASWIALKELESLDRRHLKPFSVVIASVACPFSYEVLFALVSVTWGGGLHFTYLLFVWLACLMKSVAGDGLLAATDKFWDSAFVSWRGSGLALSACWCPSFWDFLGLGSLLASLLVKIVGFPGR